MGGQSVGGSSGSSTLVGVNILPGETRATGSAATVDLLAGDGTVAQVALPTTAQGVQQSLAPVSAIAGAVLGPQASGAVTQLTDGLAPTVATVTSAVDQVATPLLDTVNGVLAPVTAPLAGESGVLAPVTGLVQGVTGGLLNGGEAPGSSFGGPLVGADVGGNVPTGGSTNDTLVGVNLLPSGAGTAEGQLVTADVLTQGTIVDVALPTTAVGVEAGLEPVGNLAGTLLGPQAGAGVDQVAAGVAPVVATVTSTVDSIASPVLDAVNGLAPTLPGGTGGGSPLAPVTDLVGGVLAPVTGGSGPAAPVTGLLGGLLGH